MDVLLRILAIPEAGALAVIGVCVTILVVLVMFHKARHYQEVQAMCAPSRAGLYTGMYQQSSQGQQPEEPEEIEPSYLREEDKAGVLNALQSAYDRELVNEYRREVHQNDVRRGENVNRDDAKRIANRNRN